MSKKRIEDDDLAKIAGGGVGEVEQNNPGGTPGTGLDDSGSKRAGTGVGEVDHDAPRSDIDDFAQN